jgi:sterol desaturase/sphingolipid hydroxylase (fatty acid hydroxylase superfamily)
VSFETLLLDHESAARFGFLFGTFALMALWELMDPLRTQGVSKSTRWSNHVTLAAINIALLRVLFPFATVGLALYASERGAGIINMFPIPYPLAFIGSLLALDLAVYLFHLLFHGVPALWRVHRLHHADLDIDVSTGVRFHPLQIVLSVVVKSVVILIMGAPALAVLTFELMSPFVTLFSHTNVRISPAIDRVLGWMVVTPDMHRVHHSIHAAETNSNYGFILPWWDHLFGTYQAEPSSGHQRMIVGIESFRTNRDLWLDRLIINPFLNERRSRLMSRNPNVE